MKLKSLLEKLYHKNVFLPPNVKDYTGIIYRLLWTPHAKRAAETDRYGKIDITKLERMLKVDLKDVIEVEKDDITSQIIKMVIRKPYDKERDVVIAFIPDVVNHEAVVKTVWSNLKSDIHKTLRKDLYSEK